MPEIQKELNHSCEHILQIALKQLFPNAKRVMGPPIDEGFYCDCDYPQTQAPTPDDFAKIEKLMQEVIDAKLPITLVEKTYTEAKELFKDNPYKLDTLEGIKTRKEKMTICVIGKATDKSYDIDLCAGPHAKNTGEIKAFKLLSVAGAYYKGSEKNKMLTRLYGVAFDATEKLEKYLWQIEEAKKRDHRKIGQELGLFAFADEVGPGLVLWTPKGNVIREELENWAKETEKLHGYVRVATPHIAKHTLYEISGHLPYYRDDMYSPMNIDGEEYFLKGMNCPHHHMIYKASPKSYRDLPLRYAEYGMVYRFEQSGALFGLMRVRSICQNDAHIYCAKDQAEEEFLKVLKLHEYYYNKLGLTKNDYYILLALPDEAKRDKYHGDKKIWDEAEKLTRAAIEKSGIECREDIGGAAFYGPKTDFTIRSVTGREFAISTNQLDLYMPTRFNLVYTDRDGGEKLCAVIHRAPLGSHERFIGFLIEHFAGAFPVWLSPVQIQIIPIGLKHVEYAQRLLAQLKEKNLRAELDDRSETMQAKIRDAQMQKVPYMMVVGDKEMQNNTVSIRLRSGENYNDIGTFEALNKITQIYLTRSLNLW